MSARFRTTLAILVGLTCAAGGQLAAQTPPVPAPADPGGRVLLAASLSPTASGGATLSLSASGPLSYHDFALEDPPRVVLDLIGIATPIPVRVGAADTFVRKVRCAFRPDERGGPTVRYVIQTAGTAAYHVDASRSGLSLVVEPSSAPVPAPAPVAASAAAETELPPPATAPISGVAPSAMRGTVGVMASTPEVVRVVDGGLSPHGAPHAEASLLAAAEPVPGSAASVSEPAPQAATSRTATMRASAGVNAPEAESAPTPMSLDVQNADVRTVFRSIAQFAGVNIVADNNVSGTVTIRALDLPWRGMLEAVCRSASLVVIEDGPVMRVATQRTAQEEALARESSARKQEEVLPLETRVLRVRYANAEELQETLGKIVSERGQVEVDARTNTLIVTDIAPRLESLEAMVQRLDTETVQVEIMAKIVDVDATVARQLGITWGASGLQSPGAHASGSLAIGAGEVAGAAADVQVGFLRSFGEIEARLQALEDERQAEIVSAPRITTVDNRMARILVGKQVPLITQDFAGNAITELKKVGIALEVTPHINADNQITMDLHPEISDLASATSTQGGIIFTTTEAETRVLVGDGETAVIGGLMRHGELTSKRGVPLLKDIPLLGRLFRSSERRVEKRELLIFVTPRIVKSAAR